MQYEERFAIRTTRLPDGPTEVDELGERTSESEAVAEWETRVKRQGPGTKVVLVRIGTLLVAASVKGR